MKIAEYRLMCEALRRYCTFHAGEPVRHAWVGLGTEAEYRPAIEAGLLVFHAGETPPKRCMGWLVLTAKGEKILLTWLANGYAINNLTGLDNPPPFWGM